MSVQKAAPFHYPGSKDRVGALVWEALGDPVRYVEPFAGALGVLFARPGERDGNNEVANDANGHLVNVWRSIRSAPDEVAWHLDGPATTADLNARHGWMRSTGDERIAAVSIDPDFYDAKTAAWYVYGLNVAPHPRAWMAASPPSCRANCSAKGHLANRRQPIVDNLTKLAARIRRLTILAGDWSSTVTPAVLRNNSTDTTGVFLDPPYGRDRADGLYGVDSMSVAADVHAWCMTNGDDHRLRIVLAGYVGEGTALEDVGWGAVTWSSQAGGESRHGERLWFSPHCMAADVDRLGFSQ